MKLDEMYAFVKANENKKVNVSYNNGTKLVERFFISASNNLCRFKKGSNRQGYIMTLNEIENIVTIEVQNTKTPIQYCRANLKKVEKYLADSKLWIEMLRGVQHLQTLSDDELNELCKWDKYHSLFSDENRKDNGISFFGIDCFIGLFGKGCIKTINFESFEREHYQNILKERISKREDFKYSWTKGYDNRVVLDFDKNGNGEGWYSEEFRGYGNGHYYYLLDEKHVLFGEND